MRERSKTLEDKLAQLGEECAACQGGRDKEAKADASRAKRTLLLHQSQPGNGPIVFCVCSVCAQQTAEPLGCSKRAPEGLQTQETEVGRT